MMLGRAESETIGVPRGYVDRDNNAFMTNFSFLVDDIVRSVAPLAIVEIGSEEGETTRHLAELARSTGGTLHVVDPSLAPDRDFGEGVLCHPMKSREFLGIGVRAGLWIVDGDHNHATVTMELNGAYASREAGRPFVVFLHDVGWPWARRDMFYDPSDAPAGGLLIDYEPRLEGGPPTRRSHMPGHGIGVAPDSGGDSNGVLTAVEDFMARNVGRFGFLRLDGFFGLGVLYERDTMPGEAMRRIEEVGAAHAAMRPLLASLEANRLRLIQSHFDKENEIRRLQASLDRLKALPLVGGALALGRRLRGLAARP